MGITTSTVVPFGLDDVFAWHERPGALPRLVPPWQPLRVQAEPTNLRDGRAELRLPGGLFWVAQHRDYDAPRQFVDVLTSLPLPWRHVHHFEAVDATHTRLVDEVQTPVPGRVLRSTFAYRHQQLADDLAAAAQWPGEGMTVAITGSSGLVGTNLAALLTTSGHRVVHLVRRAPRGEHERCWDPNDPDRGLLEGVDAVVHLAGASIAGRFNEEHRRAVRDSRVGPTRRLAALAASTDGIRAFVSASAIGLYGADRGDEVLDEEAPRGTGFLADVVADWEADTAPAAEAGIRTVQVRTGIVQSPRGGALRLLRPLFLAGAGGRLGSGRQWTSWIDLDDLSDIYLRALHDPSLSGPVNATAPEPVRNSDYTRVLARTVHRPALLPVPPIGPRVLLGAQGAREVALADQRVVPARLLEIGHRFRHSTLTDSLRHQLGDLTDDRLGDSA